MEGISVTKLIEGNHFMNLTPEINTDDIILTEADVMRPSLPLTGFFMHFNNERLQVLGVAECRYIMTMSDERKEEIFDRLCSYLVPGIIFSSDLKPDDILLEKCHKYGVPCMIAHQATGDLISELIQWLKTKLAPRISIHGVLVDVYGEGVLIMGDSGVGKSEAALELIRRGHRLVADDVVEIRKVSDINLLGRAPNITKNFIELRGVGIIDVKALFGVECIKEVQSIDLVIKLEDWDKDRDYDRLGMEDEYTEILGVKVVCNTLPIRPGRNLAVICETAAVNYRQKKMGYYAAKALYDRVTENMIKSAEIQKQEEREAALVEKRRHLKEELARDVDMDMTDLSTIDLSKAPAHYGELERNACRVESERADLDDMI